MQDKLDLESAYALETPEDNVRLYRKWPQTYDGEFAQNSDYILHEQVARHYTLMGGFGPVLDVGAGTGLCGVALRNRGIEPVDGTDISAEMLDVAAQKDVYRTLFAADLLAGLEVEHGCYQGAISAGTFTHGHVGPDGIDAVLPAVRTGGWIVISVNAEHYEKTGFAAKMTNLEPRVSDLSITEVAIYGPAAQGDHASDTAFLLAFRKA